MTYTLIADDTDPGCLYRPDGCMELCPEEYDCFVAKHNLREVEMYFLKGTPHSRPTKKLNAWIREKRRWLIQTHKEDLLCKHNREQRNRREYKKSFHIAYKYPSSHAGARGYTLADVLDPKTRNRFNQLLANYYSIWKSNCSYTTIYEEMQLFDSTTNARMDEFMRWTQLGTGGENLP